MHKAHLEQLKTAKELGIFPEERDALIWVYDRLANDDIAHRSREKALSRFKMEVGCSHDGHGCGTVACIGGWAWLYMHFREIFINVNGEWQATTDQEFAANCYLSATAMRPNNNLRDLYFPYVLDSDKWDQIHTWQAKQAILNFLRTGSPNWKKVLSLPDPVEVAIEKQVEAEKAEAESDDEVVF